MARAPGRPWLHPTRLPALPQAGRGFSLLCHRPRGNKVTRASRSHVPLLPRGGAGRKQSSGPEATGNGDGSGWSCGRSRTWGPDTCGGRLLALPCPPAAWLTEPPAQARRCPGSGLVPPDGCRQARDPGQKPFLGPSQVTGSLPYFWDKQPAQVPGPPRRSRLRPHPALPFPKLPAQLPGPGPPPHSPLACDGLPPFLPRAPTPTWGLRI